jgi:hypothetical protein
VTRRRIAMACAPLLALAAGACSSSGLPQLPVGSAPVETGAVAAGSAEATPYETTSIVRGTPTEVYALVASGALRCWMAPDGPLKATHVFHAEAAPPAEGGAAEIVLHERDVAFRDQRGPRAFRITFAGDPGGVRMGITAIKIAAPLSELMARDVAVWAGGAAGCQARTLARSPPPAASAQRPGASKASPAGQR